MLSSADKQLIFDLNSIQTQKVTGTLKHQSYVSAINTALFAALSH